MVIYALMVTQAFSVSEIYVEDNSIGTTGNFCILSRISIHFIIYSLLT